MIIQGSPDILEGPQGLGTTKLAPPTRSDEGTVYETEFFPDETGVYRPRQTTGGINTALILAAVAAYFFAG